MKLLDYFLIDHISRKNARAAVRELERSEERRRRAEETAEEFARLSRFSPVATLFAVASLFSVIYMFFSGRTAACYASLFVLIYSTTVAAHNSVSWGRGLKYYALLALCSAISFSGIYLILSHGRTKAGVALIVASIVAFIAVLALSASACGSTDSPPRASSVPPASEEARE